MVLLAEDTDDLQADESFAELVETGRVDGLMIASARPSHPLLGSPRLTAIPHVFVNREMPDSHRNVGMDLIEASRCAVDHLYQHGHRHIGHVAGPASIEPSRQRESGFTSRATELGLDAYPVERAAFSEAGGAEAATTLLQGGGLTALYVSTLSQAVGVMHATRALGLSVPDDVSIVAYDDLPLADYLDPPLTTIAMPLVELGAAAVDAVIARLGGNPPSDVRVAAKPLVISRASVRQVESAAVRR